MTALVLILGALAVVGVAIVVRGELVHRRMLLAEDEREQRLADALEAAALEAQVDAAFADAWTLIAEEKGLLPRPHDQ